MIKNARERILDGFFLILLERVHQFLGIVIDVLDHEDEFVVFIVICLRAAEDELDPDEVTFEISHHAVVGRCTAGCEVLLQILGIRAAQELLLVFRPDHVYDHHSPVRILEVIVNDIIRDLGDVDAARRICYEVDIH